MGQYQQADCSRRIQNKYHYILQLKYINMYIYCMGFNFVVLCFMDFHFCRFCGFKFAVAGQCAICTLMSKFLWMKPLRTAADPQ